MYDSIKILSKTELTQTALVWFYLVIFLTANRTKLNHMLLSLAVRMIFIVKTSQTAPRTPLKITNLYYNDDSSK